MAVVPAIIVYVSSLQLLLQGCLVASSGLLYIVSI